MTLLLQTDSATQSAGGVSVLGVHLMGLSSRTGQKLLLTLGAIAAAWLVGILLRLVLRTVLREKKEARPRFWSEQSTKIVTAILLIAALPSIWFDQPGRVAAAAGFFSAGIAFAMQKVVTAIAAYFVILRGRIFAVGDRIEMSCVRGDVVSLGFIRTTIMEIGEVPKSSDEKVSWVEARQYTGRIVTVTNDKIFEDPVYNFTKGFPYVWDELHLPVSYKDDRARVEEILLEAAKGHTVTPDAMSDEEVAELQRRYLLRPTELAPRVYFKLTDNWLEMTVRFLAHDHGVRARKDEMSRYVIAELDKAKIGIASATYDIVGLPPVKVQVTQEH